MLDQGFDIDPSDDYARRQAKGPVMYERLTKLPTPELSLGAVALQASENPQLCLDAHMPVTKQPSEDRMS